MDQARLKKLLDAVADGRTPVADAVQTLTSLPSEDIDFAHIDHHRSLRKGFPEVIYGQGKRAEQITAIMTAMARQEGVILVTRVAPEKADAILTAFPDAQYDTDARMLVYERHPMPAAGRGTILVLSAGTSDIPVAREAYLTAKTMGHSVTAINDVGVAGIHRLFAHKAEIEAATVLVVVAGMEGALPSVVAGMVGRPIIAVPTSVGYGTSFGGITALLAMLNSCSSNVAVVNIDNGFGGGYMAAMINRK
ncbi:MAG: nickel pincer cofactor biosynthesis protein LarB [Desulfosarcinaceae bacterium]|nr:nickel pincer cofactor biosynthesis protein LarB [Desulfosarcinaceae bacterium]